MVSEPYFFSTLRSSPLSKRYVSSTVKEADWISTSWSAVAVIVALPVLTLFVGCAAVWPFVVVLSIGRQIVRNSILNIGKIARPSFLVCKARSFIGACDLINIEISCFVDGNRLVRIKRCRCAIATVRQNHITAIRINGRNNFYCNNCSISRIVLIMRTIFIRSRILNCC